ncbi:MAG TPA: GNAT family N-acetyltransferase [Polyangia bacterium]|nr:GNAT family N-acetyltransferase [Polyangia bacterium]
MTRVARWSIEWRGPDGERLRAREPTAVEVRVAAPTLAAFYNEPHNQRMLTNTCDLTAGEVGDHFAAVLAEGGRAFLLTEGDRLIGDADLRGVTATDAELAILIGDRGRQGQGLGTRFGIMLHAFAFEVLRLGAVYAAVSAENAASLRLFTRLGHRADDGARARRCADALSDVTSSVTAPRFAEIAGRQAAAITFVEHAGGE